VLVREPTEADELREAAERAAAEQRAAELAELQRRADDLAREQRELAAKLAAASAPPAPGTGLGGSLQPLSRHWNFEELSRLVDQRAAQYPERVDEWRIYLEMLAPHVSNGLLGPAYDRTVWEVFGPLVQGETR